MVDEPLGMTLTATALVHEAYLRLQARPEQQWDNPGHFFAAAARAMRRILTDQARRRASAKRGGEAVRVDLDHVAIVSPVQPLQLLALDDALRQLEERDQRKSDIVHLRFFAGRSVEETARFLGVSTRLVEREWAFARTWLEREINRM
jgi:RNA polymerase sigma factor (TIGR02999 family)